MSRGGGVEEQRTDYLEGVFENVLIGGKKGFFFLNLKGVRMTKLVDEPLRSFSFFHDPFFVVLSDGA